MTFSGVPLMSWFVSCCVTAELIWYDAYRDVSGFVAERSWADPKKIENRVSLDYTNADRGPSLAEYGRAGPAFQGK